MRFAFVLAAVAAIKVSTDLAESTELDNFDDEMMLETFVPEMAEETTIMEGDEDEEEKKKHHKKKEGSSEEDTTGKKGKKKHGKHHKKEGDEAGAGKKGKKHGKKDKGSWASATDFEGLSASQLEKDCDFGDELSIK